MKRALQMKKVIKVKDLCCSLCCERLSEALELKDGVLKASANKKRNAVYVEVLSDVSDDFLRAAVEKEGFEVLSVERRKGLF